MCSDSLCVRRTQLKDLVFEIIRYKSSCRADFVRITDGFCTIMSTFRFLIEFG